MRRILVSGAATFAVVSALALVAIGGLASPATSPPVEPTASPAATSQEPAGSGTAAPPEARAGASPDVASHAEGRRADLRQDELAAARDAVAASLQRRVTGNFVVDIDPANNRLRVVAEAADADDIDAAVVARNAGNDSVEVEVAAARDITVEPLGDTPTAFPPYEAGLHIDVGSGDQIAQCTSGYAFTDGAVTYGSTAGHCGQTGDPVTVGSTVIDTVAINPFEGNNTVRADAALYSLGNRGWTHRPVLHGQANHTAVVGSLADQEITPGLELCFSGRATPDPSCGPVNAAHRVICCDANDKSFVFSCTDRPARAGDSGTAVFQRLAADRIAAAGLLSSSVTIDGRSSMCFSSIDNIESETGTTIVTTTSWPPPPAPAPAPEPTAPTAEQATPASDQPAPGPDGPAPTPEQLEPPPDPTPSAEEPAPAAEQPAPTPPPEPGDTVPGLGSALGRLLGR